MRPNPFVAHAVLTQETFLRWSNGSLAEISTSGSRDPDDELIFTLYDGQLTHISIEFPDCPKLMSRLPRVIGPLDAVPADQTVHWRGEQVLLTVYARYNSPCSLVVMWCPVDGRPLMAPAAALLGLD